MATKPSVMDSVRAAVAFARAGVPRVAGVLGLVMLLNIAGDAAQDHFAIVATFVAALLASLMANAALLRLAFAEEHQGDPEFAIGRQGFQFGRPETRLLGAILLLALFGFLAVLFLLLLVIIFTIALLVTVHGQTAAPTAATKLPPDVQAMVSVLIGVFALAMLWVAVRICLYPAATIAQKRVQVFSTWALTAGVWWRIFAAFLILLSPAIVLAGLLAASQGVPALQLGVAVVAAAVNAFVEVPLFCGLYAHLYKLLRTVAPATAGAPVLDRPAAAGLAGPWG